MKILGIEITRTGLIIAAAIIAVMMIHPALRRILWVILPMGRGWDDILFIVAAAVLAVIAFVDFWTHNNPLKKERTAYKHEED
jgi:hypothetical protein